MSFLLVLADSQLADFYAQTTQYLIGTSNIQLSFRRDIKASRAKRLQFSI